MANADTNFIRPNCESDAGGIPGQSQQNRSSPRPDTIPRALSVAEFCTLYCLGRTYVFEQIKIGALTAKKAGRRTLIAREDGEAWFARLPLSQRPKKTGAT